MFENVQSSEEESHAGCGAVARWCVDWFVGFLLGFFSSVNTTFAEFLVAVRFGLPTSIRFHV